MCSFFWEGRRKLAKRSRNELLSLETSQALKSMLGNLGQKEVSFPVIKKYWRFVI